MEANMEDILKLAEADSYLRQNNFKTLTPTPITIFLAKTWSGRTGERIILPKKIVRDMGLKPKDKLRVFVENDRVYLIKAPDDEPETNNTVSLYRSGNIDQLSLNFFVKQDLKRLPIVRLILDYGFALCWQEGDRIYFMPFDLSRLIASYVGKVVKVPNLKGAFDVLILRKSTKGGFDYDK
jgi:bifunctional DNA-binding transcriptional regulator/antitoxin component of YhaV-PrlF toxin-antitoxin module